MQFVKFDIAKQKRTTTDKNSTSSASSSSTVIINNNITGSIIKNIVPVENYSNLNNLDQIADAGLYSIMEGNEYSGLLSVSIQNKEGEQTGIPITQIAIGAFYVNPEGVLVGKQGYGINSVIPNICVRTKKNEVWSKWSYFQSTFLSNNGGGTPETTAPSMKYLLENFANKNSGESLLIYSDGYQELDNYKTADKCGIYNIVQYQNKEKGGMLIVAQLNSDGEQTGIPIAQFLIGSFYINPDTGTLDGKQGYGINDVIPNIVCRKLKNGIWSRWQHYQETFISNDGTSAYIGPECWAPSLKYLLDNYYTKTSIDNKYPSIVEWSGKTLPYAIIKSENTDGSDPDNVYYVEAYNKFVYKSNNEYYDTWTNKSDYYKGADFANKIFVGKNGSVWIPTSETTIEHTTNAAPEVVEWSGKVVDYADILQESSADSDPSKIVYVSAFNTFAYEAVEGKYSGNWQTLYKFQDNPYITSTNPPTLKNNIFKGLDSSIWTTSDNQLVNVYSGYSRVVKWSGKVIENAEIQPVSNPTFVDPTKVVFIKSCNSFAYEESTDKYINNWGTRDLYQSKYGSVKDINFDAGFTGNMFMGLDNSLWEALDSKTLVNIYDPQIYMLDGDLTNLTKDSDAGEIANEVGDCDKLIESINKGKVIVFKYNQNSYVSTITVECQYADTLGFLSLVFTVDNIKHTIRLRRPFTRVVYYNKESTARRYVIPGDVTKFAGGGISGITTTFGSQADFEAAYKSNIPMYSGDIPLTVADYDSGDGFTINYMYTNYINNTNEIIYGDVYLSKGSTSWNGISETHKYKLTGTEI